MLFDGGSDRFCTKGNSHNFLLIAFMYITRLPPFSSLMTIELHWLRFCTNLLIISYVCSIFLAGSFSINQLLLVSFCFVFVYADLKQLDCLFLNLIQSLLLQDVVTCHVSGAFTKQCITFGNPIVRYAGNHITIFRVSVNSSITCF